MNLGYITRFGNRINCFLFNLAAGFSFPQVAQAIRPRFLAWPSRHAFSPMAHLLFCPLFSHFSSAQLPYFPPFSTPARRPSSSSPCLAQQLKPLACLLFLCHRLPSLIYQLLLAGVVAAPDSATAPSVHVHPITDLPCASSSRPHKYRS